MSELGIIYWAPVTESSTQCYGTALEGRFLRYQVSNRQGLSKLADLRGDTLCLRPVASQIASLGLYGLCHCAVLLENLLRYVAFHRVPSSQRPCFSSDGISTEWVLFPLQRRPLQQRDGRGLLLVAAHVALGRLPWTSCRRRCAPEQRSSGLWTA